MQNIFFLALFSLTVLSQKVFGHIASANGQFHVDLNGKRYEIDGNAQGTHQACTNCDGSQQHTILGHGSLNMKPVSTGSDLRRDVSLNSGAGSSASTGPLTGQVISGEVATGIRGTSCDQKPSCSVKFRPYLECVKPPTPPPSTPTTCTQAKPCGTLPCQQQETTIKKETMIQVTGTGQLIQNEAGTSGTGQGSTKVLNESESVAGARATRVATSCETPCQNTCTTTCTKEWTPSQWTTPCDPCSPCCTDQTSLSGASSSPSSTGSSSSSSSSTSGSTTQAGHVEANMIKPSSGAPSQFQNAPFILFAVAGAYAML